MSLPPYLIQHWARQCIGYSSGRVACVIAAEIALTTWHYQTGVRSANRHPVGGRRGKLNRNEGVEENKEGKENSASMPRDASSISQHAQFRSRIHETTLDLIADGQVQPLYLKN